MHENHKNPTSNYKLSFVSQAQDDNTLSVKTSIGESYQCFLPNQDEVNKESESSYSGPSPLELLSPLFSKQACSYRVNINNCRLRSAFELFWF